MGSETETTGEGGEMTFWKKIKRFLFLRSEEREILDELDALEIRWIACREKMWLIACNVPYQELRKGETQEEYDKIKKALEENKLRYAALKLGLSVTHLNHGGKDFVYPAEDGK